MKRLSCKPYVLAAVVAATVLACGSGRAALIAWEPFLIGDDPAAGEYVAGQEIATTASPQNPTVPGFTGAWQGNTGLITPQDYVLPGSPPEAVGGSARFQWGSNVGERQIYRELDTSYAAGGTQPVYYLSGLMELDPGFSTANGSEAMLKLLGGGYGMRWGFRGTGSDVDAVVQYRDTDGNTNTYVVENGVAPGTHQFVMRLEQNQRDWVDRTAVWLNPDPVLGEADLAARRLLRESGNVNDGDQPMNRLYVQGENVGPNVPVYYDEIRFGTTWADALPASAAHPNRLLLDEAFSGAAGSQPTGWEAFAGSNLLVSENDGTGEYQQKKLQSPAGATTMIASYAEENDIAQGKWRDVTLTAKTRFSGGGQNENGVIFRAADIDAAGGSGDFYHARVNGNQLQLYRFVDGSATLLEQQSLSGFSGTAGNNWYRVSVENIPDAGTDQVHIVAEMFKNAALTDLAGRIDYIDTASNAITRPGGVGFRSYNTGDADTRSVFDDLTAVSNNPELLWYDDYFDGSAPHMTAYGTKPQTVTGGKYQFENASDEGIGFVDLPAVTSQSEWADVEIRGLMRMASNGPGLSGGLLSRVTGVDDPGAGANTTTGDFYMYRLQRAGTDRAQLYRRNDGAFTLLDEVNLGFDIPSSENVFLKMLTGNLGDTVHLRGLASLDPDFNDIFGEIYFTDTSEDRILGPGSAGFRAYGDGTINFDNFSVRTTFIPEPGSLTLLGLAAIWLLAFGRRQRRAARQAN